jgi:uncharacterized membrane protein
MRTSEPMSATSTRRSDLLTGILLGIGIIGAIDEAVFHQILQWHTLYWGTDERGRLLSDGVFHLLSAAVLVWGALRLAQIPQPGLRRRRGWLLPAILLGAGGFNLYDGLIQHLLLHWHLVNEFVCPTPQADNSVASCPADLPFEAGWLVLAVVLLAAGVAGWRSARD